MSRVELKEITPPRDIQQAMEKQMQAERARRAAILTAEGDKRVAILTILKSEGEKESAIVRAAGERQATVLRAEGEAALRRYRTSLAPSAPSPAARAWPPMTPRWRRSPAASPPRTARRTAETRSAARPPVE